MNHGDIYDAIFDDESYARLPDMVAKLTSARSATLYSFAPGSPVPDMHYSYFTPDILDNFHALPDEVDIWMTTGRASGVMNKAISLDDYVPESVFRHSALWNEVYKPHGDDTGHSLGIMYQQDGHLYCSAVQRSFSAGAFGRPEMQQMDRLALDLHRIYRARHMLQRQNERISTLTELLNSGSEKIALIDSDLRLLEGTPSLHAILNRKDGMAISNGRLSFATENLTAAIRKAAEDTIHRRPTAKATFLCPRPDQPFPLHILVLPASDQSRSSCILAINDGHMNPERMQIWLHQFYGVTPSEASVALALISGQSPEEIAATRTVRIATIRTQIRQLLEKTDCKSVTHLIILLTSVR